MPEADEHDERAGTEPQTGRELWLLRHAKSAWDADVPTDFDRPLAKRGRKDMPRLGAWMRRHGLCPDHVVVSPARRSEETLALLLEALGEDGVEVQRDERIYEAALADLVAVVRERPPAARRVLLVGHNPGLDDLVSWLAAAPPPRTAAGKLMTTGALARFALSGAWRRLEGGRLALLEIVRPREI